MKNEEYEKINDRLVVKRWLFDLARSRNMEYEDEGDAIILTFTSDHTLPISTSKKPEGKQDHAAESAENQSSRDQKGRFKKTS